MLGGGEVRPAPVGGGDVDAAGASAGRERDAIAGGRPRDALGVAVRVRDRVRACRRSPRTITRRPVSVVWMNARRESVGRERGIGLDELAVVEPLSPLRRPRGSRSARRCPRRGRTRCEPSGASGRRALGFSGVGDALGRARGAVGADLHAPERVAAGAIGREDDGGSVARPRRIAIPREARGEVDPAPAGRLPARRCRRRRRRRGARRVRTPVRARRGGRWCRRATAWKKNATASRRCMGRSSLKRS